MRTPILLALAVLTAGCAATGTAAPSTPTPTPTAAKVKLDAHAREACVLLDSATGKRSGDPIGANQDEFRAVTEVHRSHVAGLRKIAARYPDGLDFDKAAPKLRAWCHAHGSY